jgi:hypothetical protein
MKRITTLTLLLAPLALAGCNGAFIGNLVVLGMTVGIFFGTLSLGRHADARSATRSASESKNA